MANVITFYDPKEGTRGKEYAIENIHEHDLIDGDRITHRELMFMGAKTSGTYNIQVNGKYLNIRREVDGVTTILNSNLDTHGEYSQLSIMAVEGAKYYIEGALKQIRCSSNQLTTLDVSKCTALNYLDCYSNQLTTLDFPQFGDSVELIVGGNLFTADIDACKNWLDSLPTQYVPYDTNTHDIYIGNDDLAEEIGEDYIKSKNYGVYGEY